MDFDYNPGKSASNKCMHGIDFIEAQALWDDPHAINLPSLQQLEERFLVIGVIGNKYWTAIITYRNDTIRLISVRRSRNGEVEVYAKNKSFDA